MLIILAVIGASVMEAAAASTIWSAAVYHPAEPRRITVVAPSSPPLTLGPARARILSCCPSFMMSPTERHPTRRPVGIHHRLAAGHRLPVSRHGGDDPLSTRPDTA
jgi:hypothetical protein